MLGSGCLFETLGEQGLGGGDERGELGEFGAGLVDGGAGSAKIADELDGVFPLFDRGVEYGFGGCLLGFGGGELGLGAG
ncbi:MAG: hypothetical protein AAFY58_09385, partial [Planctomycetota bacterium]